MNFVWGVLTGLFIREIADYLPSIGRWLIKRSVRGLTEPAQTALREERLNFATKLPGGLTKVLWGLTCNWLGPQVEPANPATAARLVRALFFLVYLKLTAHDFIRLRFASARQLKLRWQMMRMFADQAIAVRDPNAKQPMLELAQRLQDLKRSNSSFLRWRMPCGKTESSETQALRSNGVPHRPRPPRVH